MSGYTFRGTTHEAPVRGMTPAEERSLAVAVVRILRSLEASLAASADRQFRATERSCCGACGALYAGPSCDVCRAYLEAAS